ncbi:hypothetical protein MKX03_002307 [Papaver bracteatum]|nr:hypothetical protein MKX03_002307 [Papaver bracteatum]
MVASESSQIGFFLLSVLAFAVYFETTSVEALTCNAGETYVETPIIAVGPGGSCSRSLSDCDNRCAGQGRPVRYKQCQIIGFLRDWTRCQACCGAPPPRPSPPSPPPPATPPPPPPRPSGDLCDATENSFSRAGTSCTGCTSADCSSKCTAIGETVIFDGCNPFNFLCTCCCTKSSLSSPTTTRDSPLSASA